MSYDNEMTLRFNGEQVHLIDPPRAHTEGDTITVFERANVIHTGDLFVNASWPYMRGSSIDGYVAAQERILKSHQRPYSDRPRPWAAGAAR